MMTEVILLQPKPRTAFHGEMVCRVMEHVIADITENQTGKHSRRQAPKNQKKQAIKKKRERDAYNGRHDKPSRIIGIIVMHAVNHIVQPFAPTSFGFVVEYVSVDQIFYQRPEQNAEQKQRCCRNDRQLPMPKRDVKHVANDRQIQHQWSHRMHPGKKLHEVALEHAHGFVLVRDVQSFRHG